MAKAKLFAFLTGLLLFWQVFRYYYVPYFVDAFLLWPILSFVFLGVLTGQLWKLVRERRTVTPVWLAKIALAAVAFFLSAFPWYGHDMIEPLDWLLLRTRRDSIVEQVKKGELKPNASWNSELCKLPFEFPIVSNGGNDILISNREGDSIVTVKFWIYRNYFESPSTFFVYTNNLADREYFEKKIVSDPGHHWKLAENWYRNFGE